MTFPEPIGAAIGRTGIPAFPPVFSGMAVAAGESVCGHAVAGASAGRLGAGDLCWSMREDRATAAFVLEPEVPLEKAAQMQLLLAVAIGDALGAIGPPNLALTYGWPGRILANGAQVGSVRTIAVPGCDPQAVPRFLIAGYDLAISPGSGPDEPGRDLRSTRLHEEGCGDLDRTMLVEAIARHFLSWLDGWQADGFAPVHQSWMARADGMNKPFALDIGGRAIAGTMLGLDEEGGLLVKTASGAEVVALHRACIESEGGHG